MFLAGVGPGGDGDSGPVGPDTLAWALPACPRSWQSHASEDVLRSARLRFAGAAGASAPRSPQSGPGRQGVCFQACTPHPAALPSGWLGEESGAASGPVAAGCSRGQRSQAEPAACWGPRWHSSDTLLPRGRGLSSFGSRPSAVQEVGKSIKGVFQFAFFLLFLVSHCLLGPATRSLCLKDRHASPGQHTGCGARPSGCSLSEGPLFTGP